MSGGALSPLRHPVFRAIWIGTVASSFGSMIQSVGAAWLMTSISSSTRMVALVQASATLPIMLLALFAGAIADSYDRRRVMLVSQLVMFAASATLAGLTYAGLVFPADLLLLTLMVGVGTALNGPSWQASIRNQVPIEDLPAAVALNSIGFNLARSLGPAIGGLLMALFGPAANFAINSMSYSVLIVVLLRWRPDIDPPKREPLTRAIRTGVAFAAQSPPIRRALIRAALFGILTGALWALMPLVARDLLHGDQKTFGILLGSIGAGSIMGALTVSALRHRLGQDSIFGLASACFGIATLAAAWSPSLMLMVPFLLLGGASWVTALSTINIVVQTGAPPTIVGRCLSQYHMCAFGGQALGAYLWGSIAQYSGLDVALVCSAVLLIASPLMHFVAPLPQRVQGPGDFPADA